MKCPFQPGTLDYEAWWRFRHVDKIAEFGERQCRGMMFGHQFMNGRCRCGLTLQEYWQRTETLEPLPELWPLCPNAAENYPKFED